MDRDGRYAVWIGAGITAILWGITIYNNWDNIQDWLNGDISVCDLARLLGPQMLLDAAVGFSLGLAAEYLGARALAGLGPILGKGLGKIFGGRLSKIKDPAVRRFAEKFEERYPNRDYQAGHKRTHSKTGQEHEIDFETDNSIIEITEGRGKGKTKQIIDRQDEGLNPEGKPCILLGCGKKPIKPSVKQGIEEEGGIVSDSIDDVLDIIEPDPVQ